jgi:hypothetical protein
LDAGGGGRGPTVVKRSQFFRERNGTNIDLEALKVRRATWAALAKRNKKKIVEIGAFLSEIGAKFKIALSGMIERCVASGAASAQSDASRCALPRPTDAMEWMNDLINTINIIKESSYCLLATYTNKWMKWSNKMIDKLLPTLRDADELPRLAVPRILD